MMTNLIHIPVSARAFGAWSGRRNFQSEDCGLHALVTGLFGRQALQPFRYFETRGAGAIYGYSQESAEMLSKRIATYATPDVEKIMEGPLRAKTMPLLAKGSRVGFDLKTCPIRRQGHHERDAHDVDLESGRGRTREESFCKWLSEKLGSAAEIEQFRISQYSKEKVMRKRARQTLPIATMQGTLVVSDADVFAEIVASGVGRHKAFGFGMLLLRPADPEEI